MTKPESHANVPVPGTPLITQADCWRRQRESLRVLAGILDAHRNLPAITWSLGSMGGLTGDVIGLGMPPGQVRAIFTAWQQALGLQDVKESAIRDTGIVSLAGTAYRGVVRVVVAARAYYPVPDDTEVAEGPAPGDGPGPGRAAPASAGPEPPAVRPRTTPPGPVGRPPAGPLVPPLASEGPPSPHIR